jgi:hypothetical protein
MSISKSLKPYKNCRNDLIALLLSVKGVLVKDQSRAGLSESEKSTGSPDFRFTSPEGDIIAIMEAFTLTSFNRSFIESHLKRLFKYDAFGCNQNFILVYAEIDKLTVLWQKYLEYLAVIDFEHRLMNIETNLDLNPFTDIKIARASHERNDCQIGVYHIFVKVVK